MPARADARRNAQVLLDAAREAFAEHGTDASLRDVARRAGVGIGTLYRHFPAREALLEALLRDDFDRLTAHAAELAGTPPLPALMAWLRELAVGQRTIRGLPESVLVALRDEESQLHASCKSMRDAGGRLLASAQEAGAVRADLTANELLALVAGLVWASEYAPDSSARLDRLLMVAMEGVATSAD
ncbi:TetR/AcrR family transcriptional regulator [Phytomonospora endophytica]|uniref:AcrR family transcriptional regulator n=1 Tax=Phytomonospora endophytica TaxID=714109 RepID=A0A841FUJ2_9ACTN|nr:TetR/AcrR family transcriptional regulator [Phytomonospora endophytica]MBB6039676.1 AcrR family transcriptional regulator [Phytomonospora endophytica]GIG65605.1 TetR family transcriptional regulator [Phytomonospora endophytica]